MRERRIEAEEMAFYMPAGATAGMTVNVRTPDPVEGMAGHSSGPDPRWHRQADRDRRCPCAGRVARRGGAVPSVHSG